MNWTLMSALQWSADFLKTKGYESPRVDAEILLCSVLGFRRVELYTNFDRPLDEAERERYRNLIRRRVTGEPVAYILGEKGFFGRDFFVSSAVLIPRPETELLVERVLAAITAQLEVDPGRQIRVLDVGTGSGCIAISIAAFWLESLANRFAGASLVVDAWDVSEEALAVASKNAERHGVATLVRFARTDMLDPAVYREGAGGSGWNFIVSNPPYIGDEEFAGLSSGVKDFEPRLALWGHPDGLHFYRKLAQFARPATAELGKIFLEIGFQQGESVKALLQSHGWDAVSVELDYARHPRNVIAVNPR